MFDEPDQDRIVYSVVTVGGGEDGRDASDKGGHVVFATFDKTAAEKRKGSDSRLKTVMEAVDLTAVKKAAMAKLTPLDCLVLGLKVK